MIRGNILNLQSPDMTSCPASILLYGGMCGQGQEDLGKKWVKDDMKLLGLQPGWAIFRDVWRDCIHAANV